MSKTSFAQLDDKIIVEGPITLENNLKLYTYSGILYKATGGGSLAFPTMWDLKNHFSESEILLANGETIYLGE